MHEQLFFLLLTFARVECISDELVVGWDDSLTAFDLPNELIVLWMNGRKLELGHARKLLPRFRDFFRAESRNLHVDSILPDRRDDRLCAAEVIDAFPNHFHRLVEVRLVESILAG